MIKIPIPYSIAKGGTVLGLGAVAIWSAYLLVMGKVSSPLLNAGLLIAGIVEGLYCVWTLQDKYIVRSGWNLHSLIYTIASVYSIIVLAL